MANKAYAAGLVDGAEWDLSGFEDAAEAANSTGWDAATINAIGSGACAQAWGVPCEGTAWEQECSDYERGVREAILAR